jgi:very-short-patch-repair endonuclease
MLDKRSRSRPESHLRVAASAPDLPKFEVNESVYRDEGGWLAEPDLSLREAKIALEYQGKDHAGVKRMRKDITRGLDLRREGWLGIPFGPAEVFGRPWQIAPELRRVIRERAPHLLRPRALRRVAA